MELVYNVHYDVKMTDNHLPSALTAMEYQANTDPTSDNRLTSHLKSVREQILNMLYVGGTILGTLYMGITFMFSLMNGWQVQRLSFGVVVAFFALATLLRKRFSYDVQVYTVTLTTFIVGVFELIRWGIIGSADIWMIVTVLLATGFRGMRGGMVAYGSIVVVYAIMNVLVQMNIVYYSAIQGEIALSPQAWFSRTVFLLIITAMLIAIIGRLGKLLSEQIEADVRFTEELADRTTALSEEIEKRKGAETALAMALSNLQDLDRLKDDFMDSVSHELRTPIANLQLYHQLIEMRPERAQGYLKTLNAETARLTHIVEQMLYASSVDDIPHSTMVENDLPRLTITALETFQSDLAQRDITLVLPDTTDKNTVLAAPEHVDRLLKNLVDNAVKYTPEGGTIALLIDTPKIDGVYMVRIQLSNTVADFVPEENTHIFDRFVRGTTSLNMGVAGAGLGLPIAVRIAKQYGGNLTMRYDDETETITFSLWMPESGQLRPEQRMRKARA